MVVSSTSFLLWKVKLLWQQQDFYIHIVAMISNVKQIWFILNFGPFRFIIVANLTDAMIKVTNPNVSKKIWKANPLGPWPTSNHLLSSVL